MFVKKVAIFYGSLFKRSIKDNKERCLVVLLSVFAFSMLASGYSYFNAYPIHDAINHYIAENNGTFQLRLGRYLLPIYMHLRGDFAMPWVTGFLSMIFYSVSIYAITTTLGQMTFLEVILTCGYLTANLFTLELNAIHQYYADAFSCAMMLACLGVYFMNSYMDNSISWKNALVSFVCLYLSYGLYPAYFTTAICLTVIISVRELLDESKITKKMIGDLLKRMVIIAIAGLLYLITNIMLLKVLNLKAASNDWSIFTATDRSLDYLKNSAIANYKGFWKIFFSVNSNLGVAAGLSTILLTILVLMLLIKKYARHEMWIVVLLIALLTLFPLASRLVNVFTGSVHTYRTTFAQFLFCPMLIWLLIRCVQSLSDKHRTMVVFLAACLSLLVIAGNISFNNGGFAAQRVLYERSEYHTGRVIEDMQAFGVQPDERVAIVGKFKMSGEKNSLLERYSWLAGFSKDTGITYPKVLYAMSCNLGYGMNFKSSYANKVKSLPEVKAMPAYPNQGYIAKVKGYIVVKLS